MHSTVILLVIVAHVAVADDLSGREDVRQHKNFHLLPKDTDCGPAIVGYGIVEGRDAKPGEFPWMAQLLGSFKELKDISPFLSCDGSVINNKYIVTAAHCIKGLGLHLDHLSVRLGALYTNNTIVEKPVVDFETEEILVHNQHKFEHNDIALVRVRGEIKFNEFIKPICLPTSSDLQTKNFTGIRLTVMGWGLVQCEPKEKPPTILQAAEIKGFSQEKCQEIWSKSPPSPPPEDVIPSQICAIGLHNETSCHGDSGGPLVYTVPYSPVRNVMVGVVSFGSPNCDANYPSVYTRASSFTRWILDNIRE